MQLVEEREADSTAMDAKAREGNAWKLGLTCESCGLAVRTRMVIYNCPQITQMTADGKLAEKL